MDFAWNDEELALRRSVIQFAQKELTSDVIEEDLNEEFSWDGWRKCARFGIQGLAVPEEYGGGGTDILTTVCALEALGYGCRNNGLIFSINAHMWGCELPLVAFGSEEQKRKYLPKLVSGESVGVRTLAEPPSQIPGAGVQADHKDGSWVLNGSKTFVTNAQLADVAILFASAASGNQTGLTGFIVEKGTPGLTVSRELHKMGLRTSPSGDLVLADCAVPGENILGEIGSGPEVLAAMADWERICTLASYVGMMQRLLETSARYATERRQFGQSIGKFPAVAAKIADMDIRLETARLVLYKAAWLKKTGKHPVRESAIARAHVADAAIQTCRDALQIHGGYGYMTEYQIERDLRDAVSGKMSSGSTDGEKVTIAGLHGL